MKLVQYFVIRYLWIDAICITQDSEEDWRRESLFMSKVYRYSTQNIAASDANDGNRGCFFSRDSNIKPKVILVRGGRAPLAPFYVVQARSGNLEIFEERLLYCRA